MENRAHDWFAQARNDWDWGRHSASSGFHAQACFIAQQVAEKALQAIAYTRGATFVRGHSVAAVCAELSINDDLAAAAHRLDQYYIPTRYPNALPAGAPFQAYGADQSEESLEMARLFLERAEQELAA
jgi:HEPN domain-containing protein